MANNEKYSRNSEGSSGADSADRTSGRINPTALTVDEAAALLQVESATVRRHIASGLPTDKAGRINLIEYVAWMVQRLGARNAPEK